MKYIIIFVGLIILASVLFFLNVEGFSYAKNPCRSFRNCSDCAGAAGCGWCPDLQRCHPMAQDGFPIRTEDLTTGNPEISPYLQEGVVPVLSECPKSCGQTDLGDCNCLGVKGLDRELIMRFSVVTNHINKLLKSTRIHVCSPHTFVTRTSCC